jgi:hypothetical protein
MVKHLRNGLLLLIQLALEKTEAAPMGTEEAAALTEARAEDTKTLSSFHSTY